MSHTPGPLIVVGPKEFGETETTPDGKIRGVVYCDYAIAMHPGGPGTIIAEFFGRCGENTFPDSKANAMLFAAAPDLLNACKDALALVENDKQYTVAEAIKLRADVFNTLIAAMRKAGVNYRDMTRLES